MNAAHGATPISVWLIEDHEDFRAMVSWQINQIRGVRCAHDFGTCEDALAALEGRHKPQVVLCDLDLPGMDGITGIQRIKALSPQTQVIVLTVYDDPDKVFGALCAGASGYLLKNTSEENLANAIEDVANGGAPMSPLVARLVLNMLTGRSIPKQQPGYHLTPREKQVLELMVQGLTRKEIAAGLGVSFHTVNTQLRTIYEKLHVHTRSGAVAKALKERLF